MTATNETCSCGATFSYEDETTYTLGARTAAKEWREQHQHTTVNGVLVVPEGTMGLSIGTNEIEKETP